MNRHLIVTADDFGLSESINAAVETAADVGVLSAASLMVGAPAAAEAIRVAREHPKLRIGLHLVLTDGCAVLSQQHIPDLVDRDRCFRNGMVKDAFAYLVSARLRKQVHAEIRAQFEAFQATGLPLDHVNAHKHFHFHPILLRMILELAVEFGSPAMRLPAEPLWFSARAGLSSAASTAILSPWAWWMRSRVRACGMMCNDQVFGISCTGAFDTNTLLTVLARLPAGVTEVYLHPALQSKTEAGGVSTQMPGPQRELDALLNPQVLDSVRGAGIIRGGFRDFKRSD